MGTRANGHVPVLLAEAIEGLRIRADGRYLDATFGRGGHARALLGRLGPGGTLLVMDRDPEAIAKARDDLGADPRVRIRHANFAALADWEEARNGLDGVLFDFGVSSPQLDDPARGFGFQADGPLDMRMDPSCGEPVAAWLARAADEEIAGVLREYGEERHARRLGREVGAAARAGALTTTRALADVVVRTLGAARGHGRHPATRTFQALRIFVNDELGAIDAGLDAALRCLRPGGRLAAISFHSLEDRRVKQFIRRHEGRPTGDRRLPETAAAPRELVAVGKARFAGDAEVARNPRARSAVLRIAERCP
jgi:16S rRNA (cytosine1402-N4)-methyltransferase